MRRRPKKGRGERGHARKIRSLDIASRAMCRAATPSRFPFTAAVVILILI
jgi:hypothetical protein